MDNSKTLPSETFIIKRKGKRRKQKHHGGSWKVAFADFAIAMMAFFLLMWILGNTSEEEKKSISEYFEKPSLFMSTAGRSHIPPTKIPLINNDSHPVVISPENPKPLLYDELEQEHQKMMMLKQKLEQKIDAVELLKAFKNQIFIDIISEGLRIQIFDDAKQAMFPRSSSLLSLEARTMVSSLAGPINEVENRISITGHTDASPFYKNEEFTNWELSAERANSARQAIIAGGLKDNKIAQVIGLASTILFDKENPGNPLNRRISIIVLNQDANQVLLDREEQLNSATRVLMEPASSELEPEPTANAPTVPNRSEPPPLQVNDSKQTRPKLEDLKEIDSLEIIGENRF